MTPFLLGDPIRTPLRKVRALGCVGEELEVVAGEQSDLVVLTLEDDGYVVHGRRHLGSTILGLNLPQQEGDRPLITCSTRNGLIFALQADQDAPLETGAVGSPGSVRRGWMISGLRLRDLTGVVSAQGRLALNSGDGDPVFLHRPIDSAETAFIAGDRRYIVVVHTRRGADQEHPFLFGSTAPIRRTAAGDTYLRAELTTQEHGDAQSAEAALDKGVFLLTRASAQALRKRATEQPPAVAVALDKGEETTLKVEQRVEDKPERPHETPELGGERVLRLADEVAAEAVEPARDHKCCRSFALGMICGSGSSYRRRFKLSPQGMWRRIFCRFLRT